MALAALICIALALLPLLMGRLPQTRLTVDDPATGRLLSGFFALEVNATDAFRWSRPESAIFLFGFDGRPAALTLRLATFRPPEDPPTLVAVSMRGRQVGSFVVAPAWRLYHVLTPTDPAGDTALLVRSTTFRATDGRDLGVALALINAAPVAPYSLLPPPLRALFLGSLPLLGWLILIWPRWRAGQSASGMRWGLIVALALLAGAAAAFPIISGYYLPTVGWPWWPIMPLALALGWPGLVRMQRQITASARFASPVAFWGGLALALAAALALRLGLPPLIGLAALVVGISIAAAYRQAAPALVVEPTSAIGRGEIPALAALTILALIARFYRLDDLPAGLWRDEARHGLQALQIWNDPAYRPVYVVSGADLPALMFYLMAPVVEALGPGAGAARLVSALAGALMPLALWWAARPMLGWRAAVAGAALLAWASWGLSMSRWAFPATLDHVLELTAAGIVWRLAAPQLLRARQGHWQIVAGMACAGALAGLAAYAYHTGRMAPLMLAVLTALRLGRDWRAWRAALPALAAAALVGLLALLPMLRFIVEDFEGYNRRTNAVAIANSESLEQHALLPLLLANAERYLLMWHVAGDANGRHHAPGAPMLDPLAGTLLALGAGLALVRRRPGAAIPLIWMGIALIPGVFSTDAPHAMRSLGALAPACMLAGVGFDAIYRVMQRTAASRWPAIAAGGLLGASLAFNAVLYFGVMPRDPAVYREFEVADTMLGRVARAPAVSNDPRIRQVQVFLSRRVVDRDVVRFLTFGLDLGRFDGAQLSRPAGDQALVLLPANATDAERAAVLAALGPAARELATPRFPDNQQPLFLAYGLGEGAQLLLDQYTQAPGW